MGGVRFKMDMSKLMRGVGAAAERVQHSQELMDAIGETLVSSTIQRFQDGAGPDGKRWKPSKRAESEGGQTLVKSGQLRNSISYEASPKMVCVGTNKIYARIHHLGGKAGRGLKVKLPARPYLGIDDEDRAEIKELMMEELKSMFGA
ncbi:phage virion morphogenesis protein [Maridesulfovibrio bastinii]|uniref:phage virion morphogenesis protein n=1 Tax=Maridesulfovibrio bastinii TaxID=47157 RepID=UPI000407C9BA|nr:phage virion morphogenesis protein [Maridesulfovibrio bastinii]